MKTGKIILKLVINWIKSLICKIMPNNWTRYLRNWFFYNHKPFYNLTYEWLEDFCRLHWDNIYLNDAEVTEIWVMLPGGEYYLAAQTAPDILTADINVPFNTEIRVKIRTINISQCTGDWSDELVFTSPVCYFVKNGGNNLLDGLSDATAWETIAKVNTLVPDPNTCILFKRASTWREQLGFSLINGTEQGRIRVSAYGAGNDPRLLGSKDGETIGWTNLGGNKYATPNASFTSEVFKAFYDTNINSLPMTKVALEADLNVNWEFWYDAVNDRIIVYHSLGSPETQANGIEICGVFNYNTYGDVIFLNNCDFWEVSNMDIRYVNRYGYVFYQSHNGILKNSALRFTYNKGINCDQSNDFYCENITMDDVGWCGDVTGGESIWLASSLRPVVKDCNITRPHNIGIGIFDSDNADIDHNVIDTLAATGHVSSSGIDFDNSSNGICHRNTVILMPRGFATNAELMAYRSDNNAFYCNIAVNCEMNYRVNCNAAVSDHVTNIYFFNNVSYYDIPGNANYAAFRLEYATGVHCYNNIIIDQQANLKYQYRKYDTIIDFHSDYNIFYLSVSAHNFHYGTVVPPAPWTMYATLADYQAGTGQDLHSTDGDPLIVGYPDFHLLPGSPAIYSGIQSRFCPDGDNVQWHFPQSKGCFEY